MKHTSLFFRVGCLLVCTLVLAAAEPRAPSGDAGTTCGSFSDLGMGTPGGFGFTPLLAGQGSLCAGDPVTLTLSMANKSSNAYLVIGFTLANTPFKGGVLVPSTELVIYGIQTRKGIVVLDGTWPPGVTIPIYFQYWVQDSNGPAGYSASNGLVATPGS